MQKKNLTGYESVYTGYGSVSSVYGFVSGYGFVVWQVSYTVLKIVFEMFKLSWLIVNWKRISNWKIIKIGHLIHFLFENVYFAYSKYYPLSFSLKNEEGEGEDVTRSPLLWLHHRVINNWNAQTDYVILLSVHQSNLTGPETTKKGIEKIT